MSKEKLKRHNVLGFMDEKLFNCPKCNSKLVDAGNRSRVCEDYVFWCSNENCNEHKEHFYSFSLDGLFDEFIKK